MPQSLTTCGNRESNPGSRCFVEDNWHSGLVFTRHRHYQYGVVYIAVTGGSGRSIRLCDSVGDDGGRGVPKERVGAQRMVLTRAQDPRNKAISCIGQIVVLCPLHSVVRVGLYTILLLPILDGVWHTNGRSRGGRMLRDSRAIVVQKCGQCGWGGAIKED